jgi:hypothetical protein
VFKDLAGLLDWQEEEPRVIPTTADLKILRWKVGASIPCGYSKAIWGVLAKYHG